jgi:hypothetical protein
MSYNSYFEDVQAELINIGHATKDANRAVWIVLPLMFVVHAVVLAVVVWVMGWIFGNSTVVVGVTCVGYFSAVIGWAVERLQQRVTRMAVHAASVHDEVLLVKELIQDEQRRSDHWRQR